MGVQYINTVAVISNGPSAVKTYQPGTYDQVIGAHKAAAKWRCDWWVICDWSAFVNVTPIGQPSLFVPANIREKIQRHAPEHLQRFDAWPRVVYHNCISSWDTPIGYAKWNTFSGLAALGLVKLMLPDQVDIYGADMGGVTDGAGDIDASNRSDIRWQWERKTWGILIGYLRELGVSVNKIEAAK